MIIEYLTYALALVNDVANRENNCYLTELSQSLDHTAQNLPCNVFDKTVYFYWLF